MYDTDIVRFFHFFFTDLESSLAHVEFNIVISKCNVVHNTESFLQEKRLKKMIENVVLKK